MKKILFLFLLLVGTATFSQVPNYVPTSNLVGYWPFTGNTNCVNSATLNATNQLPSNVTLTPDRSGTVNAAYNFSYDPGNNTPFMSVASSNVPSLTNLTLSVWFDSSQVASQLSTDQGIIGRSNSYGLVYNYTASLYTGFFIRNSSNLNFVGIPTASLPTTGWTHMVGTYDGTTMNLYINGILVKSLNTTVTFNNTGSLYFGKVKGNDGLQDQFFAGKIDDVGIWNRALTQDEVTNLFYSNVPAPVYYKWVAQPSAEPKPVFRYIINNVNDFYTAVANNVRIYKTTYSTTEYWSTQSQYSINGVLTGIGTEQTCVGCPGNENSPQIILMNNYITNGYNDYNVDYQPSFVGSPNVLKQLVNDYVRLNPSTHTNFSFLTYQTSQRSIMTSNTPTLDTDTFTPNTNKISVYPNPCSNTLNINTNETIDRVTVVDITGKTVLTQKDNNALNVEGLTNGVYFLTTYINGTPYQNKFVKN